MDRVEARRRLERSTRFQIVDGKVLIRSEALLEALVEPRDEAGSVSARPERDITLETAMVMAA